MPTTTEFWNWRHTDDAGKRRTTRWKLTRANALATLRDPEPDDSTREVRNLPSSHDEWDLTSDFLKGSSRPFFDPRAKDSL